VKSQLHIYLIFAGLLAAQVLDAQMPSIHDTVRIDDVVVKGRPALRAAGFIRTTIDHHFADYYKNGTVADLLNSASPLFVKSYGPGGVATVSFRGAGAAHTVVTWNGINLNSPMLGQSDFQLLPVIAVDDITVYYGGSSMAAAQGGLGGVVDITTKPDWNKSMTTLDMASSTGSYGRYSASLRSRYGDGRWRFSTAMSYNSASNNFPYTNSFLTGYDQPERRDNAASLQKNLLQEAWYRTDKSVTGFRVWLQEHARDLPVAINISPESHDEDLSGRVVRSMLTHDHFGKSVTWSGILALIYDDMTYRDNVTAIYSQSSFNRVSSRVSALWNSGKRSSVKGELTSDFEVAKSENYSEDILRNITWFSISADYMAAQWLDLNFGLVLPVVDLNLQKPDFSAGTEIIPFKSRIFKLRSNISSRSRVPSMNDLYWIPGGNRLLKTERALSSEIAISASGRHEDNRSINLQVALFNNSISDMIQWQPGSTGYWIPENTGMVRARGVEGTLTSKMTAGKSTVYLSSGYSYTISGEKGSPLQTIYVPEHMANATLRFTRGISASGFTLRHTGRRYITADNNQYLPSNTVAEIWLGAEVPTRVGGFNALLAVENLFNLNYQTIAYHPMPPRAVKITINWKFGRDKL
jgi:vitamin B12 transporter